MDNDEFGPLTGVENHGESNGMYFIVVTLLYPSISSFYWRPLRRVRGDR